MHTACVWSEKLPFAGYSVVKDHSGEPAPRNLAMAPGLLPPGRLRSLTHGAFCRCPVRSLAQCQRSCRSVRTLHFAPALSPEPGAVGVMENTGLEPVTSWLQTRRSP